MKSMGRKGMLFVFATWLLASTGILPEMARAQAVQPAVAASADAVPTDAELAGTNCAIGEERFVPADYYYCLGKQTYGAHRYTYARKFFTTAASWASKPAQYVLGVMALDGDQQPVNRPLALAWLTLASERPHSSFTSDYEALQRASTPAERRAADQLLETMRPVYGDPTAAARAERRYTAGMAMLTRLNNGGNQYCMEGSTSMSQSSSQPDPSLCQPVQNVVTAVDKVAADVFDGWSGHVTVEPLQQVSNPPASK